MSLIKREKLRDYFYYGVNDKSILGTVEEDQLVIDIIDEQPEVKAVEIPENITNGKMFMSLYSDAYIQFYTGGEYEHVTVCFYGNYVVSFPLEWWDAPFEHTFIDDESRETLEDENNC